MDYRERPKRAVKPIRAYVLYNKIECKSHDEMNTHLVSRGCFPNSGKQSDG